MRSRCTTCPTASSRRRRRRSGRRSATSSLETFENPGVERVELAGDELTAICPLTDQPDLYTVSIEYEPDSLCLETRSLKRYLTRFRDEKHFCEALAVRIRDDVAEALAIKAEGVHVVLRQKARGGITITATA